MRIKHSHDINRAIALSNGNVKAIIRINGGQNAKFSIKTLKPNNCTKQFLRRSFIHRAEYFVGQTKYFPKILHMNLHRKD